MMAMALVAVSKNFPAITVDNDGDHPKGPKATAASPLLLPTRNGLCLYRHKRHFRNGTDRYLPSVVKPQIRSCGSPDVKITCTEVKIMTGMALGKAL